MATYNYDAWGNHTIQYASGITVAQRNIVDTNPFRYRGYYYDVETGFYYLNSRYYDPQVGRFINADTYASTGQGLLGNNMFAYCGNNPVSRLDSTGHAFAQACFDQNSLLTMLCPLLWGGSGGGVSSGYSIATSGSSFKIPQLAHTDPQEVQKCLQENGIAFYHGYPVIYADILGKGSAFSYGIIVLDVYLENAKAEEFANTLNHEYGHAVHLGQIGLLAYTTKVAIPSFTCASLTSVCPWLAENYFSLPWERVADYLGGVDRGGYLPGAENAASLYWFYTEAVSILLGGLGLYV